LRAFQFICVHFGSESGHDLPKESSKRSDLDNSHPKGLLQGKSNKMNFVHFFSFFLSGTPPLETSTISRAHATGIYLMDFKPAKRRAGSDTCLSLYWPIELNEKLAVPVLY
jgi:hypothetical protein